MVEGPGLRAPWLSPIVGGTRRLCDIARDMIDLNRVYKKMESRRSANPNRGGMGAAPPSLVQDHNHSSENDAFFQIHREQELEELETQDEVLDRLQGGLHRLRDNAVLVRDELTVQERMLDKAQTAIEEVQVKLAAAKRTG